VIFLAVLDRRWRAKEGLRPSLGNLQSSKCIFVSVVMFSPWHIPGLEDVGRARKTRRQARSDRAEL
jgi:hypothetical protein